MLKRINAALDYQISVFNLILLAGLFAVPYGVVGTVWALNHTDELSSLDGADKYLSFLGEIVAWPVLIFADITLS